MEYLLLCILEIVLVIQSLLHAWSLPIPSPQLGSKCTELVRLGKVTECQSRKGF